MADDSETAEKPYWPPPVNVFTDEELEAAARWRAQAVEVSTLTRGGKRRIWDEIQARDPVLAQLLQQANAMNDFGCSLRCAPVLANAPSSAWNELVRGLGAEERQAIAEIRRAAVAGLAEESARKITEQPQRLKMAIWRLAAAVNPQLVSLVESHGLEIRVAFPGAREIADESVEPAGGYPLRKTA